MHTKHTHTHIHSPRLLSRPGEESETSSEGETHPPVSVSQPTDTHNHSSGPLLHSVCVCPILNTCRLRYGVFLMWTIELPV